MTDKILELRKKYPELSGNKEPETDFKQVCTTLTELENKPFIEEEVIIHPLLCKGGLGMIYGETGIGKSHFSMNLAYAIAMGGNFLKFSVPKPQKILYVDGELGQNTIKRYHDQIVKNQGKSDFPENFVTISYDQCPQHHLPRIETNLNLYFNFIMENQFDGIFIDNLATCTDIDENSPKEWKPIQRLLLRLRAHDKFVWLIHHAGTDKSKERGITARKDILNTVISLQKIENFDDNSQKIKISFPKHRNFYGEDCEPFEATHKFTGGWDWKNIDVSNYEQVIKCCQADMWQRDIAAQLKISQPMVSKYRKRAEAEGRLSPLLKRK